MLRVRVPFSFFSSPFFDCIEFNCMVVLLPNALLLLKTCGLGAVKWRHRKPGSIPSFLELNWDANTIAALPTLPRRHPYLAMTPKLQSHDVFTALQLHYQ